MMAMMMTAATTDALFLQKRSQASLKYPMGFVSNFLSCETSLRSANSNCSFENFFISSILFLSHADPGVDKAVADIDHDAGKKPDKRIEDGIHHEHVIIEHVDGLDIELPDAGNGEDLLDDHGTAQNGDECRNDHGQNGHHGILQRMAADRLALFQALRAGKEHIIGGQRLGELRAGEARQSCDLSEGKRDNGGHHAPEHRARKPAAARIRQRTDGEREPAQFEAKEVLHQKGIDIHGNGNEQHDKRRDRMILPFVLFDRRDDAQADADGDGDDKRIQVDEHGRQDPACNNIPCGFHLIDIPRSPEIPLCEDALQIDAELDQKRFFIAERFPARLHDGGKVLIGGQRSRQDPDEHEADGDDHEEREQHQKYSFYDIFCHGFPPR